MENKMRILVITLIIILFSVVNILMPVQSFSAQENRYLQKLPPLNIKDIFSGKYTADFEKYTTDQFPLRDMWVKLKTATDLLINKKDNGRVYFGKDDFLFDVNTEFSKEQFNKNMEHIKEFIQNIKELDENIKLGALLIPSKDSIHSNLLPEYAPTLNEKEIMEEINKQLSGALNIVELMDILNENSKEYIYYKTDHHWTTKGAYYGYLALSDFLGYNPYLEEEFNIQMVSDSFLGTIYRKANLYKGEGDKIFKYSLDGIEYSITINEIKEEMSLYDESYLEKVDKYSYFLGGDYGIVDIKTNLENDKTLVIIKDSFANSIIPFLSLHYERIILLDTRYFGGSIPEYIVDREVDEILFVMNIQNFSQLKSLNVLSR